MRLNSEDKNRFAESLSVCSEDLVIAATSYDVNLSDKSTQDLCEFLKGCFPQNCIVINSCIHYAVAATVGVGEAAPQLATHTHSLVFWFRLQLNMQHKGFDPNSLREVTADENCSDKESLLALCLCLIDNKLDVVCQELRMHILNGKFFGSEPEKVLWFFRTLIHGYNFLYPRQVIRYSLPTFISGVINDMSSYPKVLKSHIYI